MASADAVIASESTGKLATAFSFVKSKITGEQYDGGESGKVEL